jgi:succinyl-diaminopimelate desuccinylase
LDRLVESIGAAGASAEEVTGRQPKLEICPGLLESRFYAAQGIPALAYGPGLLSVSHGPHELLVVQDMLDCAATYALTALRVLDPAAPLTP